MSDKTYELDTANQELTKLIQELQSCERLYDQAVMHAANYHGNDERIDQVRDERAQAAFNSLAIVKKKIERQTQLVRELAARY